MTAKASLPDFSSHPKIIIEFAGAEYCGQQPGLGVLLHLFRDPVTGSTLALPEQSITIAAVQEHMAESRRQFALWQIGLRWDPSAPGERR